MAPIPTAGFAEPAKNVREMGISSGMNIADFGAGSGAYTIEIGKILGERGYVYAIDIQRDLLRRLKNESDRLGLKAVEIIWADLEQPGSSKLADRSVDFVLMSNVLFQLPEKRTALREAMRILKPGKTLAIIDWTESFGGMGPIEQHVVTKDASLALAKESGFTLQREFPAGAHHYGLLFSSPTA